MPYDGGVSVPRQPGVTLALGASVVVSATCVSGFPKTVEGERGAWNSVCPPRMSDVEQGAFCADEDAFEGATDTIPVCDYADGFCACELDSCATPAGPVPDCAPSYRWSCTPDPKPDGCPFARRKPAVTNGDPCQHEGQICSYDTERWCFTPFTCSGGAWRQGQESCAPSAAPR
jgi:hypothetical protein